MALVGHISGSIQSNSVIGVSGSVIVANRPDATFPSLPGTDVGFYVHEKAVFSNNGIVSSGSISVTNGTTEAFNVNVGSGTVSGSGNFQVGGSITLQGNLDSDANEAKSIFSQVISNTITIGGGTSTVASAGDIKVGGDDILASDGVTALTLSPSTGNVAVSGDLQVSGNDIKASDSNVNITMTSNALTEFAGDIKVTGNDISGSAGLNITLGSAGNITVAGDVTVGGNDIKASDGNTNITLASNTLTTFAGDIKVTGNDIQASDGNTNITMTSNTLTAFAGDIKVTGNDIQASDGNTNITLSSNTLTTFAGDIKVTGNDIQASDGNTNITMTSNTITAFAGDIKVGGNDIQASDGTTALTLSTVTGNVAVAGDLTVTGNDISGSSGLNITLGASGDITVAGDVIVGGNDIKASDGNTNITLTSNTLTTFAGDIKVVGNDIQASDGNTNITMTSNTLTEIKGDLQVTGNDIKSSTGGTAITLDGSNVIIPGDLTVNGTTTTINTNNLEIKDAVVGFGFASGTIQQAFGDRGWIGGQSNGSGLGAGNNVANFWDQSAFEFVMASTSNSATGSLPIPVVSYLDFHANNIQGAIVSASLGFSGSHTKLIDGTSAFIGGTNISITTGSNGAVTISSAGGGDVTGPGSSTQYAVALFDDTTGKVLRNSALTTNGSDTLYIAADLNVSGSTVFGNSVSSDLVSFANARVNSDVRPSADMTYELGSPSFRWRHIYTGDLHLRNDRGDYTLIEEEDFLSIRFNKTGKRYKFLLEPVPELDEEIGSFSTGPVMAATSKNAKVKKTKTKSKKK